MQAQNEATSVPYDIVASLRNLANEIQTGKCAEAENMTIVFGEAVYGFGVNVDPLRDFEKGRAFILKEVASSGKTYNEYRETMVYP